MATSAIRISHHSGDRLIPIIPDEDFHHTVYRYVRQTHHFLDDDNHDVAFIRDPRLPWINFYRPLRDEMLDGSVRHTHWFSQYFSIIDLDLIERLIEEDIDAAEYTIVQSRIPRDTRRGRAAAERYRKISASYQSNVRTLERFRDDILADRYFTPNA